MWLKKKDQRKRKRKEKGKRKKATENLIFNKTDNIKGNIP
jgi:hypothetical protein